MGIKFFKIDACQDQTSQDTPCIRYFIANIANGILHVFINIPNNIKI